MYEETTGEQGDGRGDSSCDDEEEQKEPPPEPTRFGWIQGVMVGRVNIVFTTSQDIYMCIFILVFFLYIYLQLSQSEMFSFYNTVGVQLTCRNHLYLLAIV